ncbi:MAG: right-handed parallel beta-helix repeat-containing protein [Alphaproteobacteria bacterium]
MGACGGIDGCVVAWRRRAVPWLLACAVAALPGAHEARADADAFLTDPAARAAAWRDSLGAGLAGDPATLAPAAQARLVADAVGLAASGCDGSDDAALVSALAPAVADPAAQVEAFVASAACAGAAGDGQAVRAALHGALEAARTMPAPDDRDRLVAWIADIAGASGALPADEIMEWAKEVTAAPARATVVRAWALARFVDDPQNPLGLAPVGPYAAMRLDSEQALALAGAALAGGEPLPALQLAAASATSAGDDRTAILQAIYDGARAQGDFALARIAAMATARAGDQRDWLAALADDALAADLPGEAALVAGLMAPSRAAINVWLDIARRHRDAGYPQWVTDALDHAEALVARLPAPERAAALARVAGRAAQLDEVDRAAGLLAAVAESDELAKAISDLAKRLAELGRLDEARDWAGRIDAAAVDVELRSRAFGAIAKAEAEDGDLDGAIATLESRPDLAGRYRDRALRAIAVGLAASGEAERARAYLDRIEDAEERARAEADLGRQSGLDEALQRFGGATAVAATIADAASRDALLLDLARAMLARVDAAGFDAALDGLAARIDGAAARATLAGLRMAATAPLDAPDEALDVTLEAIDALADPRAVAEARSMLAWRYADAGDIRRATAINRGLRDWRLRLTNFRAIAEEQAARLDVHGLIAAAPVESHHIQTAAATPAVTADGREVLLDRAGLAAFSLPENDYRRWPELIGMSDRLGTLRLQPADIRARFPAVAAGRVHRMTGLTLPYNRKFTEIEPVIGQAQAQGEPLPQVIYIEDGVVTLPMVREQLLERGAADYLTVEDGVYLMRRPLVVGPNATLVISGAEVRELRLSTLNHVYLVAAGTLLVADTTITSWDTEKDGPTEIVKGENDYDFRPFVATWSGSHMLATRAIFRALGYGNRKSFGIGFSAGPHDYSRYGMILPSPEATLVENLFERMYYGFYSRDVITADIIGNEYRNSVIYGPDPHDYSEDILMAYNTAYGTKVKHGLIVSREVDGIFVGNIAFDNHGAGIMLDRLSNHSVIYANTVFDNGKDGIAVYETACAIVANNHAYDNGLSGVRVRNSVDVAVFDNDIEDNAEAGIVLYTDDLAEHVWRNLELDPFWTIVSATVADNRIVGNGNAIRATDTYALSMADNLMLENGRRPLVGDFDPLMASLIRQTYFGEDPLMVAEPCLGPVERYATCGFRDLGVFDADGQSQWDLVGAPDVCAGQYDLSNAGLVREVAQ